MKILIIGDIIGNAGVKKVKEIIPKYKKQNDIDFIIANGENSAEGMGITLKIFEDLKKTGIDVITMGNHTWGKKEIFNFIEDEQIIRPANYPQGVPGKGYTIRKVNGKNIAVVNLIGRVDIAILSENPFLKIDEILKDLQNKADIIILDFHAEATAEKIAMGYYLDGKVTGIFGTHTHVQTADEKILENGTAYITDVGMTGPINSIIGLKKEVGLNRFKTGKYFKYECSENESMFNAIIIKTDDNTKKAISIKRINL